MLSRLKWDVLILAGIGLGYAGWTLLQDPYVQEASEATVEGSRPPDRTEGDVLLLLPDSPAATADSFDQLDCTYGWFSSLWQYYGSFATALTRNLSPEFLAGRNVVIVPRRVARDMPSNGITALASFARNGGQVVLEQPGEGWEQLSGLSGSGKVRPAQKITSVEGLGLHGRLRNHLPDVPLAGSLLPAPARDHWPSGPTLIDVDSQPGLTARRLDEGIVYTFLFEFGCTLTGLQQGVPSEAMSFAEDGEPRLQPTASRAMDPLESASVPYADLLEFAFFQRLSKFRPLPRLWPYPGSHAGATMIVHSAPEDVRHSLGYLDYARQNDAESTLFLAGDRVSSTELGLVEQTGADLGLLWVRGLDRPRPVETVGLGALRPYARELSLRQQRAHLERQLGSDRSIRLVRTEGARHDTRWARTFREMAAADLQVDVSYGPIGEDEHGYLFGSGFPFYPLDRQGLPLPVLELPFLLHGPNLTRDRLRNLLVDSEKFYHQAITVSVPADVMRTSPTAGVLLAYRDVFELADEHDHWTTSVADFTEFLSARRRSVLTSQWDGDKRRLTVSVNLLGARLDSIEGGAHPGVALPQTYENEGIERVVVDGEEYDPRQLVSTGTGYERLLELPAGRHTISVFYRSPPGDEDSPDASSGN